MAMRIEKAIASIYGLADRWVRLQEVQRVPRGLVLSFGIHKGKRGARIEAWRITCIGVHEANITAWDLGGLALYSSTNPAAREHTAPQARLRWSGAVDEVLLLGALYKAHSEAVDEWIPFESYSSVKSIPKDGFVCEGPDFLMRAYAKALRSIGKQPHLILGRRKGKNLHPRVLHFGTSHVVADKFIAERCDENTLGRSARELKAGTGNKGT